MRRQKARQKVFSGAEKGRETAANAGGGGDSRHLYGMSDGLPRDGGRGRHDTWKHL